MTSRRYTQVLDPLATNVCHRGTRRVHRQTFANARPLPLLALRSCDRLRVQVRCICAKPADARSHSDTVGGGEYRPGVDPGNDSREGAARARHQQSTSTSSHTSLLPMTRVFRPHCRYSTPPSSSLSSLPSSPTLPPSPSPDSSGPTPSYHPAPSK